MVTEANFCADVVENLGNFMHELMHVYPTPIILQLCRTFADGDVVRVFERLVILIRDWENGDEEPLQLDDRVSSLYISTVWF